ncbi:serine/threonine protein kinase [Colletotrichum plurivorum]|uniref:Serine/threonine protein kinase n=1 Tax=Colletotrichum plurivorum TaxID=2175906 RepID=A0A8H6JQL8_9PEZI|nr:serine/threonine protein kinase [Colletotrichum plurivorum]
MTSSNLYKQLDKSLQYCSFDSRKFLPRDKLDEIITKESIKNELPRSFKDHFRSDGITARLVQGARKLVAILIFIGERGAVKKIIRDDGLTDEDLPFRPAKNTDNGSIVESARGKTVRSFVCLKSDAKVGTFLEKQWLFLAPVLDNTGASIPLDSQCPLPFRDVEEVKGHYENTVYKAELHRSHLAGATKNGGKIMIAVKEFKKEKYFLKEAKNLEQVRKLHDDNLIQHMFCCERKTKFFIVFPWANGGNLKEFWERNTNGRQSRDLTLWCLQQMLGIAHALRTLHGANFRHGDLKPENILHFDEGSPQHKLVIADVGVSRIHLQDTDLRAGPTTTKATTPSYEAPEVYLHKKEPRSRQYDIWSAACIFLEFIVWMVHGVGAVENFAVARCWGEPEMKAWFFIETQGRAEIHPAVIQAIKALRGDPSCRRGTALGDLLGLITNDLLQIQVSDRAKAAVLYKKMHNIVLRVKSDPRYLPQIVPGTQELAAVFQKQEILGEMQTYTAEA